MTDHLNKIAELEQRLRFMEQKLRGIPSQVPGGGSTAVLSLQLIDGQTVYSNGGLTYYGVNYSSTTIATVPSAYDPNSVGSTPGLFTAITGIGRAKLFINGVLQSSLVLVVHQTGNSPFTYNAVSLDVVAAGSPITIPTADGLSSVSCYTLAFQ